MSRPEECMPVMGHEHISAQQKAEAKAGVLHCLDYKWVFVFPETLDPGSKVDVHKEKSIGKEQAANVGHGISVALSSDMFKVPTVSKALTVATRFFPARVSPMISPPY